VYWADLKKKKKTIRKSCIPIAALMGEPIPVFIKKKKKKQRKSQMNKIN
jgi:hypothetical protein